jgi:hypothetical protein
MGVISTCLSIVVIICAPQPMQGEEKNSVLLVCGLLVMFLVAFPVPSTFVFDSIEEKQIKSLVDFVLSFDVFNMDNIDSFEENIADIYARVQNRTKAFQWFIAVIWGAVFLISGLVAQVAPEEFRKFAIAHQTALLFLFPAAIVICVIMIMGHKKANDAIFRCIQFAIREIKFRQGNNHKVSRKYK